MAVGAKGAGVPGFLFGLVGGVVVGVVGGAVMAVGGMCNVWVLYSQTNPITFL
jgi:hypothetical protein